MPYGFTLFGGVQWVNIYNSYAIGASKDIGEYGALSFDWKTSVSKTDTSNEMVMHMGLDTIKISLRQTPKYLWLVITIIRKIIELFLKQFIVASMMNFTIKIRNQQPLCY
nr:fimbria/pilus outer membrane usher protein [Salmonella enterica]